MMRRVGSRTLTIVLLVFLATVPAGPLFNIRPVSGALSYSPPQRFKVTPDFQEQPRALQAADGKVWLFWPASNATSISPHLHLATYDFNSWSSESILLSGPDSQQDVAPSVAQLKNGTILLAFSSNRTGNFDIFTKRYNPGTGWSQDSQITTDPNNDFVSSLVAATDGTVWLIWDRTIGIGANIYYKTLTSGVWSAESLLASNTVQNLTPIGFQMSDGRIWVAWSRVLDTHLTQVYIYYRIYNGVSWTTEAALTSTGPDRHPGLMQDSQGTIWVFWDRRLPIPATLTYQRDIFYKSSADNGNTWSAEGMITNDGSTPYDDYQVSTAQLRDHRIWVFWSSNRDPEGAFNIYYANSDQLPFHDVMVTGIYAGPLKLRPNQGPLRINVTTHNDGTFQETFQLNVVAASTSGNIPIGSPTLTLAAGAYQNTIFSWDTSQAKPAKYNITASIPLFSNTISSGTVRLVPPGDVNMDGKVDIFDAALVASAYDSRPGMPNWNPLADLDNNGHVDIIDAAIVAYWFGYSIDLVPGHDVRLTSISASPLKLRPNQGPVHVNVVVHNFGTFMETFQLNVVATNVTSMTISSQSYSLAVGGTLNVTYDWNTAAVTAFGKYTVTATIPQFTSSLSTGKVWIVPPGDVDMNGVVNILDAALVASAYGSTPGSPNWNPASDLDNSGKVDILDAAIVAYYYGAVT